jgi:hypothetical protein
MTPKKYHELCQLPAEFSKIDSNDPNSVMIGKIAQDFEADVLYAERHLSEKIIANTEVLIPQQDRTTLPPSAQTMLDRYAVVDTLALHFRSRSRSSFIALLAIAFFAMLILEFFAHILADFSEVGERARLMFLAFPLLWFTALAVWYFAHSNRFQNKYHDYRALAEGLRVQLFWKLLGLNDRVENHYLHKHRGELEWIRRTIAWWREHDQKAIAENEATVEQLASRKTLARRCWIEGQLKYYEELGICEKKKCHGWKRFGAVLFWLGVFVSVFLGGCEIWYLINPPLQAHSGLTHLEAILIFAISILLTIAALVVVYVEKMAFLEHSRQYNVTCNRFHRCDVQLKDGPLSPDDIGHFRMLGIVSLQENGDWLLLHRDRPLEIMVP